MPPPNPPPYPPLTVTQALDTTFPSANIPSHLTRGDLIALKDTIPRRPLLWTPTTSLHKLNQRKADTHLACLNNDTDTLTSVVVQITGPEADTPCKRCVDGDGEWVGCVVPPARHGLKTWWACANCFRDGEMSECELRMQTGQTNKLKQGSKSFGPRLMFC